MARAQDEKENQEVSVAQTNRFRGYLLHGSTKQGHCYRQYCFDITH